MSNATLSLDNSTGVFSLVYMNEVICSSKWKHTITAKVNNGAYRDVGIETFTDLSAKKKNGAPSRGASTMSIIDGVEVPNALDKFSVAERFQMLEDTAYDVAVGNKIAAIVTGEGGLGKSFTVLQAMKSAGLIDARPFLEPVAEMELEPMEGEEVNDVEPEDDGPVDLPDNAFIQMKGYTTARGLYEALYQFNGRTIIMDDNDKALFDDVACGILKGALDTTDDRWISWSAGRAK